MSGLKILSGEARGRNLKTLKDEYPVRPILGRMKKSLFDIIRPKLQGAAFLDLFAGSGSVGLEALSEGAASAVFVEGDPRCMAVIRENIEMLGWGGRTQVHQADIMRGLRFLHETFDLVFMGPPYKDQHKRPLTLTGAALRAVCDAHILRPGGWAIAQHHAKEPVTIPEGLVPFRRETYGDTVIDFYRAQDSRE